MTPQDVLSYWFGQLDEQGRWPESKYKLWFMGGEAVDKEIQNRFGALHQQAVDGQLDDWLNDHDGRMALIILLDQFSRNLHRGTPGAFAADAKARQISMETINQQLDTSYHPIERVFLYMPLEHSEQVSDQLLCLICMQRLVGDAPEDQRETFEGFVQFAQKHLDLILRFGRFPHRNGILQRDPTPEETAYLNDGGETFGQKSSS